MTKLYLTNPNDQDSDHTALEAEVRALAHQIWEDEGQPEGLSDDHWFRATAMIAEAQRDNPNWLQRTAIEEKVQVDKISNLAASIEEIKRKIVGRAAA